MPTPERPDLPTLVALAAAAWLATNVLHEGLGHGLATVLVGGEPLAISTAWFSGDLTGQTPWDRRVVKAAGTVVNLLAGVGGALALRAAGGLSPNTRLFVWLFAVSNLFHGAGYMMTSPLFGAGDWAEFIKGLESGIAWALGITAVGVALSWAALRWGLAALEPWLGSGAEAVRKPRARWLCFLPYLAGGALVVGSATLQDEGGVFVFSAAAAVFGGEAWLAWMPAWVHEDDGPAREALPVPRSPGWIAAGVLSVVVMYAVLGPGLSLG